MFQQCICGFAFFKHLKSLTNELKFFPSTKQEEDEFQSWLIFIFLNYQVCYYRFILCDSCSSLHILFYHFQVFPLLSLHVYLHSESFSSYGLVSFFSMQSWRSSVPTQTHEHRVEAAEVRPVHLPANLFAFHLFLHTGVKPYYF